MINMFSLFLVSITIFTGFLWFLDKFFYNTKRYKYRSLIKNKIDYQLDSNIVKKIKNKPGWVKTGASIFPMLKIILIVRSFIYEPFQIPSGSMMPTLLIGDFILVEKFSYNIKDPIYQKILVKVGHPKRGDIVVFQYPNNPILSYIKRAVGLPGDKITYDPIRKELKIQPDFNSDINACNNSVLPITYSNIKLSDFIQNFANYNVDKATIKFFQLPKDKNKENSTRLIELEETLGNITHSILTVPIIHDYPIMYYHQQGQQLATWIVPPGHYFMMGDNRDNSLDSRYWGFVPEANLIGKATAIWMSFEKQEGTWPTGIRFNRIGAIH